MEDISPDGQGGVWKMVVNNGTGPVVPTGYRIQGKSLLSCKFFKH